MRRKPPEFRLYIANLWGYLPDSRLLRVVDDNPERTFHARDVDAAVELLVEQHGKYARSCGNPDTFFHVREVQ